MNNRRKRRKDIDIEDCIYKAAALIIEELGFSKVTVRELARKAEIQPIVFYKRYKDLSDFIDEFVKRYDYWFSDVAKDCESIKDNREEYIAIFTRLFLSIKENSLMQQLLRWELSDSNETTKRTANLREFHTLPLVKKFKNVFANSSVEIDAVSALIIGGIYYLTLHADLSPFGGIDIKTEEGSRKIEKAIEYFGNTFFSAISTDPKTVEIARRMKEKGLNIDLISECTGLTITEIEQII